MDKADVLADFERLDNYDAGRDMYYFERRLQNILACAPKKQSAKILDFGGGSGLFSKHLSDQGYDIYLVDLSPVQVRQALEKGLAHAVVGDEHSLVHKYKANTFDYAFMADVIEHVDNPVIVLKNIRKVMKHGAHLVITYPNPLWVPLLNFLGEIGLKLKGKDNKIYFGRILPHINMEFSLVSHDGYILVSKLPPFLLRVFEYIERLLGRTIMRRVGILQIAVIEAK